MTEAEKQLVQALGEAWNAFLALPVEHQNDQVEFMWHLHALQNQVMARPARRALYATLERSP